MIDIPQVLKAIIVQVDDPTKVVVCHFNPNTFKLGRAVRWQTRTNIGGDVSELSFSGGEAHKIGPIELLFDTTDIGIDVRVTYAALLKLAEVDPRNKNPRTGQGEPPLCQFQWGKFLSFTAVITEIAQTFTMFKADGTPVRAKVQVTFLQVPEKIRMQNPTSRSKPRKVWVVHEGQRLDWIAHQEYGDSAHWRHIAETNDLMDPRDLRPGQVLKLVPLP